MKLSSVRFRGVRTRLLTVAALALASTVAWSQQEEKVLNIYNWSDYIAPDTIANFEKETGIKVRYDNFDNNEIVHAKLVAGKTGYDIVVPSSNWAKLQLDGGLLQKLDKSKIPNLKNLDPAVQAQLAKMDPGNEYMVNWLWGFTTVGINVDKVKAALGGTPMPDNAWDLIFKPEYVSKLRSCGVSFLDSATEVIPAALHYLGKSPYSKNASDYAAAAQLLKSVRPHITLFSSSGYINDMANGSICAAMGWSGDINIARQRAIDGKTGQNIEALIPKTGGLLFFDVMVIPADAPRPGNAHKFIDYILRPEVNAGLVNKVFYANPVPAAKQFVRPEVANNPTVFLSAADMAKMIPPEPLNNDLRRLMTRTFTSFKTGL
ncbi:polyamine ABC transporter substrate-binding protein [Calidifontimicrobium sp. SYSU G02091]|uniref:polyamine ABC transporter substrate-binding protein n=1 Tax=Calidifontimicrobium sp. SYSU G02091 TaxID=2926421 RepID=UPI001F53C9E7|nr:polyamine ABC transporter substrate-binding protein [Calidifontimicrobium sp. SYSU G02091]MCI1192060.1 polyamine ABC transporter substrate-binding protein [Calidifontimicrobium sp. SYSU G02091]